MCNLSKEKVKKKKIIQTIPTDKCVAKMIYNRLLNSMGIALKFCPTAETAVAIAYCHGKFRWCSIHKVHGT
jgi:hypothetical protein